MERAPWVTLEWVLDAYQCEDETRERLAGELAELRRLHAECAALVARIEAGFRSGRERGGPFRVTEKPS